MLRLTQHLRIDIQRAKNLGIEVIQNDERYLELAWEGREIDMQSIDDILSKNDLDRSERGVILDTVYEITQIKMLKKIID